MNAAVAALLIGAAKMALRELRRPGSVTDAEMADLDARVAAAEAKWARLAPEAPLTYTTGPAPFPDAAEDDTPEEGDVL